MASIIRQSVSRFTYKTGASRSANAYFVPCSSLSMLQPRRFFSDDKKDSTDGKPPASDSNDSKGVINENIWAWVPPSASLSENKVKTYQLEVKKNVLLTTEEVVAYLEANGAEKVNVIKLREPLLDITHMVFATCSSTRLIRQLGVTISKNLKDRGLKWIMGSQGPEGAADDDWQLVDCQEFTVNLFTADAREVMDLESWWTMESRPTLKPTSNPIEFERQLAELCERFPPTKNGKSVNVTYEVEETEEDMLIAAKLIQANEQQRREAKNTAKSSKKKQDTVQNHKNIKIL